MFSDFGSVARCTFIRALAAEVSRRIFGMRAAGAGGRHAALGSRLLAGTRQTPWRRGRRVRQCAAQPAAGRTAAADEIFVFPAMGDEGLPAGGALCLLQQRDGLPHWLTQRRELGPFISAATIPARMIPLSPDRRREAHRLKRRSTARRGGFAKVSSARSIRAAWNMARARSGRAPILANPSRRETHDLLNRRLARTDSCRSRR